MTSRNKKPKSIKPCEGEGYGVELEDGRFAVAILARVETARPRKPYGIFVYFFGPFLVLPKSPLRSSTFNSMASVARLNTSAMYIYGGQWKRIGVLEDWNRSEWEFPAFYNVDFFSGVITRLELDEANLAYPLKADKVESTEGLDHNISYGSLSARNHVSKLLMNMEL